MISVVIPLFNKAPHIAQALESVLAQTCSASNIVVIDDGSTDQGAEIVASFADQGVRLIRQDNQGESVARNTGISATTTPYIAFLDADDWWMPEHLEELTRLINDYPEADLFSTSHLILRDGQMYRANTALPEGWRGELPDFFVQYARCLSIINSSTACVRRSAILAVGGFPVGIKRGPDVITWVNLALNGRAVHLNAATAVYNQEAVNRTNALRERDPPGSLQHLEFLLSCSSLCRHRKISMRQLFNRIAFYSSAGFCLEGDKLGAKINLSLALKLHSYPTALAILILLLAPTSVLLIGRRMRHKRVLGSKGKFL